MTFAFDNSRMPRIISVAIAMLLAGCAVGPDYVKPSTILAPFHDHVQVEKTAAQTAPPLDTAHTNLLRPTPADPGHA